MLKWNNEAKFACEFVHLLLQFNVISAIIKLQKR